LCDDQQSGAESRCSLVALEAGLQIGACGSNRGCESEKNPGEQRDGRGESENARVRMNVDHQAVERRENAARPIRQADSKRRAE